MSNKVALVTGASSGIGKELSYLFAKDAYDLVLIARNEDALYTLAKELEQTYKVKTYVFAQDLSLPDAAKHVYAFTQSKNIHIHTLVNNAGFGQTAYFKDADITYLSAMVQVNITALMQLTHLYLSDMVKEDSGGILNIGSIASFIPGPSMAVYFATKAFVKSFTESLSIELRHSSIHVTALCPGATETEFFKRAGELPGNPAVMGLMSAKRVAKIGYTALKQNRTEVIAGVANTLSVQLMKRLPLFLQKFIVRLVLGVS